MLRSERPGCENCERQAKIPMMGRVLSATAATALRYSRPEMLRVTAQLAPHAGAKIAIPPSFSRPHIGRIEDREIDSAADHGLSLFSLVSTRMI